MREGRGGRQRGGDATGGGKGGKGGKGVIGKKRRGG